MRSLNSRSLFTAKCIGAAVSFFVLLPASIVFADDAPPPKKEERKRTPPAERPARTERPASTPAARTQERAPRNQTTSDTPARPVERLRTRSSEPRPDSTPAVTPSERRSGPQVGRQVERPAVVEQRQNQGSDRVRGGPPVRTRPEVVRSSSGRVETFRSNNGAEARFRPDGRIQTVRSRDMVITHGAGGSSRIVVERADRTVIVTNRSGHGYIQRPFAYRGTEMVTRTYYVRGVVHSSYYRPYVYRGISMNVYVPVRTYSPAFYGFVYSPWVTPVRYSWGWNSSPWYGYYGGYFTPAPYYPSPSLWLADYIIAARLADAYQDQANAGQAQAYRGSALSPEVKQDIANEVQRQLQMERNESQALSRNAMPDPNASGLPRLLEDGLSHVFIVSYNLDVTDSNGRGCALTRGDVMKLDSPPEPNATSAYVQVVASKGQDCRTGSTVMVSLQDLQDTLNQMRESVNQGMGELQTNAGRNGMPNLPRGAAIPAVTASFAQIAPPPDREIAAELRQQVQEAERVEQDVVSQARQEDSSIAPPPDVNAPPQQPGAPGTISLGQTMSQVVNIMGSPKQIVDLGPKQIYVYNNMKIIFIDGKVSDVQ